MYFSGLGPPQRVKPARLLSCLDFAKKNMPLAASAARQTWIQNNIQIREYLKQKVTSLLTVFLE